MDADDEQATRATAVGRVARASTLKLVVVEGADAGLELLLDPNAPRILVGASPASDLRLRDDTVSRRHLTLERNETGARLLDAGSTNGTFVNDVRVGEAFVVGGELIRCGHTVMRLDEVQGARVAPLPTAMRFGDVWGVSPAMRRLYRLFERLAQTDVPIVIEGETGTGKENLAESIHGASGGPFVVFDCTTVSPTLVEAELFGHERGAFTGADAARPGMFELAHGGTLFIDEIGDLDTAMQPKLLRAIERGEIRRVGGQRTIKVTVRIIAATRRNLDREVEEGRFRDDLFHRLAVARVELPPLRERAGDVSLLARLFVDHLGASPSILTREVVQRLESYSWPGNVRELRNAVARLAALGELHLKAPVDGRLPSGPNPDWIQDLLTSGLPFPAARRRCVDTFEQRYMEHLLETHGGNVGRAIAASGVSERYFHLVKARALKKG